MKQVLLFFFSCCQFFPAFSQAPVHRNSAEMYLALRKLNVLGSVLYIAAHPDDENTRLITYLSQEKLYRTGYLSLTRGDGGQNLIGDEQGIELGLIRTQELLSARRIDGGEQFFSRAFDFGFSKGPEETFSKWDREKILSDVVWVIRKFQPDVIITRFPTTGEGGHGHHTASAILANEAFKAAADPTRFPEQLKYVQPWQAKRIFWNGFNFGGNNTTPAASGDLRLDVGGYNPLLGKSYGEIAAESRSNHKSQGFGSPASRGESFESFKLTGGSSASSDIMDGVDLDWTRVAGGEAIATMIDQLSTSFDLLHPEKSVEGLVKLYQAMGQLPDGYWKTQKQKEVRDLIVQCSGLFLDATASEQFAVQTDSIRINFSFNNRLGAEAVLQRVSVGSFDSTLSLPMAKNRNIGFVKNLPIPATQKITQPYWLENKMEEGYYNVKDPLKIGQPDVDPAFLAQVQIKIYGQSFSFSQPVKYKFTDPVKGEVYEPLVVVPPVTLNPSINLAVINGKKPAALEVAVRAYRNIDFPLPATPTSLAASSMQPVGYGSFGKNEEKTFPVSVMPDEKTIETKFYIGTQSSPFFKDMHEITYDHIPYVNYFTDATVKVVNLDVKTFGKRIGYIVGAGDKVPQGLEQMGYDVVLLGDKDLSRTNLQQFDAILTGVRAYNTNDWMNKHYDQLMKYVNDGGNLIVQYNTSNFIGNTKARIGPYNFTVSRTRITDENAVVTFLKPEHPVLNFPNKITQEDFKGWIQERSIYHGADWDKNFETIFSMSDPGEKADDGSLLIAKYGKGYFTYTGLVFFRELPAGVPGAYRLLANIIALNKKKAF
jgi:LmbE family N-acetylglucosaminyl deacetylase